ncbi:hypothetical protein OAE88_00700 [bacterium]|nr:hypothetical protein [bacterium]
MADNLETPQAGEETAPTGLPSEGDIPASPFTSDYAKENLHENGQLFGKFSNYEELAQSYRELEVTHTNKMRDVANANKESEQSVAAKEAETQAIAERESLINEIVPKFLYNNMTLTEEDTQKLVDSGIDIRDVKIESMELRERMTQAYDTVGGKENYDGMIEWGRENLSEQEQQAFNANQSVFALEGLYNRFTNNTAGQAPRVSGSTAGKPSVAGYANQSEMLKDKSYLNTMEGRNDNAAQERFKVKMGKTSDTVVFGR